MMLRALILSFVPLIAWLPGAARLGAQEHAEHLNLGRLGRVTFPVSCTAEARRRFEQAMAVLRSFWWEEGDRAFEAVLAADSTCAMAHWGRALNAWGNPFAGGPARADPGPWAPRRRRGRRRGRCRPRASRARQCGGGAVPRCQGDPECGSAAGLRGHSRPAAPGFSSRRRGHDLPRARARGHRPSHRYHLRPSRSARSRCWTPTTIAIPTTPGSRTTSSTRPTLRPSRHSG